VNVKEYISSGIIESYVMGIAAEAERQEFESMCALHPEIAEARNTYELALEEQLLNDTIAAPLHLKKQIEEKVLTPASDTIPLDAAEDETPVRQIGGMWKWLAAASIILLAGTAFWAINTNNKYKELQADNQKLQNQLQQSTARLDTLQQEAGLLQKPGMKMAALRGNDPSVYATIYWDTTSNNKDVYLMVNNLPQPASDKQYQLWALLNGQPIDLGMIEVKQERLLYRMKNVQNAQAFAITLEPKGGSPAPTSTPIVLSKL
jgi:anti-sigma-K factor RskA